MQTGHIAPVATYSVDKFDDMIREQKPDIVIVTSVDRTHHKYNIRAMEPGCDVITEKPMTTTAEKCQEILDAQKRTGREVRVSFNYRYTPLHTKCREVIANGDIGEVFSVHFEWLLDTSHGADYFRRWHRDKRNSGGLLVHKSTHHFDLVNFWINSRPKTVFAFGDLNFYGRENAENRGITKFYNRSTGNPNAEGDPFALDLTKYDINENLYLKAEHEDGVMDTKSREKSLRVFPMFGQAYDVEVEGGKGGHGFGDPVLQNDLFGVPEEDKFNRAANHVDSAMSILTGVAANKAIATGLPVDVDMLVTF